MPTTTLSNPAALAFAALARRGRNTPQPTIAELVAFATADGDFWNDITTNTDTMHLAAEYADLGAENWEDAQDVMSGTVRPTLISAVRVVLRRLADDVRCTRECDAWDAMAAEDREQERRDNGVGA